jgi:hypothetical protein
MLALVELEGKAVEADVERALAYAERAAKLGDGRAAEAVGMLKKMGE